MNIFINPGTGPCDGANDKEAEINIRHFITDLQDREKDDLCYIRAKNEDGYYASEGRFAFILYYVGDRERLQNKYHLIHMPGLPLEKVRYMNDEQNAWDYPRLYVDHDSWLWKIALIVSFGEYP